MPDDDTIISQTQYWVKSVIVGLNLCPFAGRAVEEGSVRYQVSNDRNLEHSLHSLVQECEYLDRHSEIETTLLIFADSFADFESYLDLLSWG